jgi:hypothetical protein
MNRVLSFAVFPDSHPEGRWEDLLSAESSGSCSPILKVLTFFVCISEENIFNPFSSYAGLGSTLLTNIMSFAK